MSEKITVSFGITVPGAEAYSSRRADAFYETTVRDGETLEQAYARAWAVVQAQAEMGAGHGPSASTPPSDRPAAASPQGERFRGLPAQRVEANARLDEVGVRSQAWRNDFIAEAEQKRVPMGELGEFFQETFDLRMQDFRPRNGGGKPWQRRPQRGGGYGHYRS